MAELDYIGAAITVPKPTWQKPMRGMHLNKSHPLARGLVGCWVMNEGSGNKVFDLSGNGRNGAISGATWSNGKILFDADTDYIDFGWFSALNGVSEFTIILSVDVAAYDTWDYFYKQEDANDQRICIQPSTNMIYCMVGNGVNTYAYSGPILPAGNQYIIAMVYDGNGSTNNDKLKLRLNGELIALTFAGTFPSTTPAVTNNTYIGGSGTAARGLYDYMYIFNRALTADEIAWLYREPYAMFEQEQILVLHEEVEVEAGLIEVLDAPWQKPMRGTLLDRSHPLAKGLVGCWVMNEGSGGILCDLINGRHFVIKNGSWDTAGVYFQGVGAGATYPSTDGDLSWFPVDTATLVFIVKRKLATSDWDAWINVENSTNNMPDELGLTHYDDDSLRFTPIESETNYWNFGAVTTVLPTDELIQLVCTYDRAAGSILGYRNGVQYGARTGSAAWSTPNWVGGGQVAIGGRTASHPAADYSSNSVFDVFYLYNRVLTADEIAWLHREPYAMFQKRKSPVVWTLEEYELYILETMWTFGQPVVLTNYVVGDF